MKKLFIFDLDNTITKPCADYTDKILGHWWQSLADLKPYEMSLHDARKLSNAHYAKHQMSCFGHDDICAETHYRIAHQNIIESGVIKNLPKCTETVILLEELKDQGHQLSILSHAGRDYVLENLKHLDLEHIFEDEWIFGLDSFGIHEDYMKHNLHAFHKIAEKASVDFADVIVVEDTPLNLKAPYDAGMHTVWTKGLSYFTNNKYDNYKPDYVKEEHEMLTDYLKDFLK